jgi:predicted HicB family RNase H-like nuclease
MMEYKGFKAQIDYDCEAGVFVGEVINTRDGITFVGRSVDELRAAFEKAVEEYIELSTDRASGADNPYTGHISMRIDPKLHKEIAERAARAGVSVAGWVAERLSEAARPAD